MISSVRLGDKHVCPLPGHGTTPIASASGDVNINFMGSARVGDTCGCGAVITTGFPSIQVNGRPMAWYAQIGTTSAQAIGAANGAAAMAIWTERVGQNRPWDHKPIIHAKFGGYRHKQGKYDYFYDIWSNIHYGYVGRAGGLSESVLADGAGVEQYASDAIRKVFDWENRRGPHATEGVEGAKAYDDAPDRISISIGIELFTEHPNGGITAKMIMDKVLAVKPEDWGDGVRAHVCNQDG